MVFAQFELTGTSANNVGELLGKQLQAHLILKEKGEQLWALERFYFRIDSNLLTIIRFDDSQNQVCRVTILSGGGAKGILSMGWGAEETSLEEVKNALLSIAQTQQLTCKETTAATTVEAPV